MPKIELYGAGPMPTPPAGLNATTPTRMSIEIPDSFWLIIDKRIQQRAEMDREKMREYRDLYAEGRDLGPIVVFYDPQWSHYILADGFHRVAGARAAYIQELPADVFLGTFRDALLYATGCNLHGKSLTNADKRKRVATLLQDPEWSQWSDNAIAKHCGVTQPFVSAQRKALITVISDDEEQAQKVRTYRDKHGNVRTMDTSKIGRQESPEPASDSPADPIPCGVCERPLTDPDSIERGIGPVCASNRNAHDGHGSGNSHGAAVPPTEPTLIADVPLPGPSSRLDLPTLLRATARYLKAIRDGLEDASFAETFDQYGPLWDAVHDGCMELLEILDGEPEEPERDPEPIPEPAAAESPAPAAAEPTAIPISQRIMQVLGEAEHPLTNAAIARAVGRKQTETFPVLKRLVAKGKVRKEGATYAGVEEGALIGE